MKTVIFDMHGIIYSYSPDLSASVSNDLFEKSILEHSSDPGFKGAYDKYKAGDNALAAKLENVLAARHGGLNVFEMKGAVKCILDYLNNGYKIVFASSSEVETTKRILTFLLAKRGLDINLIDSFDIICIFNKSDPAVWEKALWSYKNITDVYEDRQSYLMAASEACKNLGSKPRLYLSI